MNSKNYIGLVFLLMVVGMSSCGQKSLLSPEEKQYLLDHDSLTVAMFPYFPPYQHLGKRKVVEGMYCDYLDLIEQKIGHRFRRKQYVEWTKVLRDAQNGTVDIILEAQSTPNRKHFLIFYDNFFESEFVIVTRSNTNSINSLSSLENTTVILPEGFSVVEIVQKLTKNIRIVYGEDEADCLRKLSSGEGDAYIGPKAVAHYTLETQGISNLTIRSGIGATYKPGIAVDKSNKLLNSIIAKATADVSNDEREQLTSNWLYTQVKPFYLQTRFWMTIVPLLLLSTAILLLLNGYLKTKIKKRTLQLRRQKIKAEKDTQFKMDFVEKANVQLAIPLRKIKEYADQLQLEQNNQERVQKISDLIIKEGTLIIGNLGTILQSGTTKDLEKANNFDPIENEAVTAMAKDISVNYKILIAEDGEMNFKLLKILLEKIDIYTFDIQRAENGKEAVVYCEENNDVDLVFMDLKMPVMDGYEATQKIKKLHPSLPIIVQTAFTSQEAIDLAYQAGCDDFISKPFKLPVLRDKTKTYLDPKLRRIPGE